MHLNLCPISVNGDGKQIKEKIIIPIGLIKHGNHKKFSLKENGVRLYYDTHAVALGFAFTVWKGQGATYPYLIALLESAPNSPKLKYELLYTLCSRVPGADRFRCLPYSNAFCP